MLKYCVVEIRAEDQRRTGPNLSHSNERASKKAQRPKQCSHLTDIRGAGYCVSVENESTYQNIGSGDFAAHA